MFVSEYHFAQLITDICCMVEYFITHNAKQFMYPDIHGKIICYVTDIIYSQVAHLNICHDELAEYVDYSINSYIYAFIIPPRYSNNIAFRPITNFNELKEKITGLVNVVQPAQRTPAWYIQRSNLITASNAYKAIDSPCNINALILEKIKAYKALGTVATVHGYAGGETSFQYGIRNEPISTMYFEHTYGTKIGEFGCMIHREYPFMGASPDGIVIDEMSPLYGTMIEIKNPVSREITGIPKKDYWVQMQLQMEVCDLDTCMFLETHITYYDSEADYISDGTFALSEDGYHKGVICELKGEVAPHYEYLPFNSSHQTYDQWKTQWDVPDGKPWVGYWFWKIDKISCVMVKRNKLWFNAVIPEFCEVWKTILVERETDEYSHRLPRQRQTSTL